MYDTVCPTCAAVCVWLPCWVPLSVSHQTSLNEVTPNPDYVHVYNSAFSHCVIFRPVVKKPRYEEEGEEGGGVVSYEQADQEEIVFRRPRPLVLCD